jgi:hypothetical protein
MEPPPRAGDGHLVGMNDWVSEIGRAMAEAERMCLSGK